MDALRLLCRGQLPLAGYLADWQQVLLLQGADWIHNQLRDYGSPVNVLAPWQLKENVQRLNAVADGHQLDFQIFFARKANKALCFVEVAREQDWGIDTASEQELTQALGRGCVAQNLICTAAIKNEALMRLAAGAGVPVAIDNRDELKLLAACAVSGKPAPIALRVSQFWHEGTRLPSRFGWTAEEIRQHFVDVVPTSAEMQALSLRGLHFHLDGYEAAQRVSGIQQSLELIDELRRCGHPIQFLDIGGGIPMCYLESQAEWENFWSTLEESLAGNHEPITYRNHGLGLQFHAGQVFGQRAVYPYYQSLTTADWLEKILVSEITIHTVTASVAQHLRQRGLQLRCEPGRSLLDGCGLTLARVEHVKKQATGDLLVGLAMNRTQCRTTSLDFLVDPLLIPAVERKPESTPVEQKGYLTGAYCLEAELISLRKMRFSQGVQRGDCFVFPNTAGYLMHFLESRSHQFPLAANLVLLEQQPESAVAWKFCEDEIDQLSATR